jgi:hypothetical protein
MSKATYENYGLVGRLLSLNTRTTKVFTCGGFSVNYNRPIAIVTPESQQASIKRAMAEGKLIDVTDQNTNGLNLGGANQSKPKLSDTGETAFITVDKNGGMMIAIPKDKAEQNEFEDMIAKSGVLILDTAKLSDKPSPLLTNRVTAAGSDILLNELANKLESLKR